jgi:hypothetical protein
MYGTFRKGFPEVQHGAASDAGNGFMLFASSTGATFTIRAEEFTSAADSAEEAKRKRAIVRSWPRGTGILFRVVKPADGGAASLMVKRLGGTS